ncbi:hypothetical protein D1AOALGA4SA_11448 [Olavius algarvensis Delta 1 endosymbiont]|nr:hypothetical protein D1AOALGA4SA_11448 [Olavius algarvensis Delta 1 endosymbiont]
MECGLRPGGILDLRYSVCIGLGLKCKPKCENNCYMSDI